MSTPETDSLLRGVCQTCSLWEPEKGYRPDMANMGYCPLFDKRSRFDHGKQCTGHSSLHPPNSVTLKP